MAEITTTAALQTYYNSIIAAKSGVGLSAAAVAIVASNQVIADTNAGNIDPGIAAAFLVPLMFPGCTDPILARPFLMALQSPPSANTPAIQTAQQLQAYYQALVQAKAVPGTFVVPSGQIVGVTNANPLVISTAAPHGLNPGYDTVTIAGVGGTTNANGTFTVATAPSPTTFTLFQFGNQTPIAGNAAYTSGGTFARANVNDTQKTGHTGGPNLAEASFAAQEQIHNDYLNGLIAENLAQPFLQSLGFNF